MKPNQYVQSPAKTLAFALSFFLALCLTSQANQERILTAADGRTTHVKLVSKTDTTVAFIRTEDSKRFVLQIEKLSAADQEFVKSWNPQQREVKSVALRPRGIQYESYPSEFQPRYSSGGGGGSRGGYVQTSGGGGCKIIGITRTVTGGGGGCPK